MNERKKSRNRKKKIGRRKRKNCEKEEERKSRKGGRKNFSRIGTKKYIFILFQMQMNPRISNFYQLIQVVKIIN